MAFSDWLSKRFTSPQTDEKILTNQIATAFDDGALTLENAVSSFVLNLDWVAGNQAELIDKYREVAAYHEVDYAIDDIINEMVSFGENEEPVKLNLDDVEGMSEAIKTKIHAAFDKVVNLLNLRDTIHTRARSLYVDGRLSYQKVVDKNNAKAGLLNVVELDPRFVTKVRNVVYNEGQVTIERIEEYYVYDEQIAGKTRTPQSAKPGSYNGKQFRQALKLDPNSVTYVTSGFVDPNSGFTNGWLHKAIKPANQLRMMENSLVIYRITRAPERRVFYVDVGNLPKQKAESYLTNLKNQYRNRMSYDPNTGSFKDNKHLQTMQEDYWLPRTASGKGTEVTTLPGGANLDSIEDVIYFLKRLYKALNIPISRLDSESIVNIGGRNSEINRDELKFSKYVSKVRKRFNMMLRDLLRTELVLTNVIKDSEWQAIEEQIMFVYAQDLYLEEKKFSEMMSDRIQLANDMQAFIGKYFSHGYVMRKIFLMTDDEAAEMEKEIAEELKDPRFKPEEDEDGSGKFGN